MPPEVDPEQPHTKEQSISMLMLNCGQRLVSVVAKPVVVDNELTWKAAKRKALRKVGQVPLKYRLALVTRVANATRPKHQRTI